MPAVVINGQAQTDATVDVEAVLDGRSVTQERMDAILRVGDGSSGESTGVVDADISSRATAAAVLANLQTELDTRNVTANRLNAILRVADGDSGIISETNGTYSHQNNTNEQDVLTFAALKLNVIVAFDMTNLAQTTTIRGYEEVDGSNAKEVFSKEYPTDFDTDAKVVEIELTGKGRDMKVTFQSGTAEGSAKNVPYSEKQWVN